MPHRCHQNGCRHSEQGRVCYFCPYNPFYELLVDTRESVVRRSPSDVCKLVMPVGKLLLLDTQCEAFTTLVKPSQMSQLTKKRKRAVVAYDSLGVPVPVSSETSGVESATSRFIQVRLDVPRNYTPVHGKLYVSIHARYEVSSSTEDIRSIYVNPEDLIIPTASELDQALECFYV
jgi:hypothetical protein